MPRPKGGDEPSGRPRGATMFPWRWSVSACGGAEGSSRFAGMSLPYGATESIHQKHLSVVQGSGSGSRGGLGLEGLLAPLGGAGGLGLVLLGQSLLLGPDRNSLFSELED